MAAYAWEWIDPAGAVTPLQVEYDVRDVFAPPAEIQADVVPEQPGARFRSARHGPREFPLPLYVRHDDPAVLHTTLRALVVAMDPTRGEGLLRVTTPVSDQRELNCRAVAGLGLSQTRGEQALPTHQRAPVMFRALDPYWYAIADSTSDYTTGAPTPWFPIFPLRLAASEVFVDTTITNLGDVETWPVWTITGPGHTIRMRNFTTGRDLALYSGVGPGLVLAAGESATIDTRPGHKTITKQDGTNLFAHIYGALWPLAQGINSVRIEMSTATSASAVHVSWRNRYLTP